MKNAAATVIVQTLVDLIKKQAAFLLPAKYVRDMRKKMTHLNDEAKDMQKKMQEYNENRLKVPSHVETWLKEVELLNEKSKSIPAGEIGCFSIMMRYKVGKGSFNVVKDVKSLLEEKDSIKWTDERIPLGMVIHAGSSSSVHVNVDDGTQNHVIRSSRDLIFDDAFKSLKSSDNESQMIALSGMGGVGKTTMMTKLKEAAENQKLFKWVVKVAIGKTPNVIAIQQAVSEQTGKALTETDKDVRAGVLQKRFEEILKQDGDKMLVILDDLWGVFKLEDVGLTSPLRKGLKLLLTSREEGVCNQMGVGTSSIFKIKVLEEKEAKELFWQKIAGTDGDDHKIRLTVEEIIARVSNGDDLKIRLTGDTIAKKCNGLPMAIITIASTLRGNIVIYAWEETLFQLQNKKLDLLDNIFKISYDSLKDDEKQIFLLSGLFPEDSDIRIEDLVRYAWGLNLFKYVRFLKDARRHMNNFVNNLLRSNLLITSDKEACVRMHDLVRDFALSNFSDVKQASIVHNDDVNVSEQLTVEL